MTPSAPPPGTPRVVVIAGPNGAGKSTSAPRLLVEALEVDEFVNADTIAAGLSGLHPERVAIEAGRLMLGRITALAARQASFAFETTLATRGVAGLLTRLHAAGYGSHVVFLSLPAPEIAIARVQERVARGGHDVAPDVIRRRFFRGLTAFFGTYRELAGSWILMDNSMLGDPAIIASKTSGGRETVIDVVRWDSLSRLAST
jgi:predicted ABC-type ATPase